VGNMGHRKGIHTSLLWQWNSADIYFIEASIFSPLKDDSVGFRSPPCPYIVGKGRKLQKTCLSNLYISLERLWRVAKHQYNM
jgi:hypothetical protein